MYFDLATLDGQKTYKLMTATVVPRPIAWVVTHDRQGRVNAAPFSFFGLMSGDPPIVCVGVGARANAPKDTGLNLREQREFVINLVSTELMEKMNITAVEFGPEVDELAAAGLATAPSINVAPPRIAASPVAFECRVEHVLDIAAHRCLVVGRAIAVHVRDDAVIDPDKCYIDTPRLDLVGRMQGGGWYSLQHHLLEMPRLTETEWRRNR